MKRLLFSVSAGFVAISGAHAADAVVYDPAPVPVIAEFSWAGAYVGAYAGYGFGEATTSTPDLGFDTLPFFPGITDINAVDTEPHGALAGVTLGYNWQEGSLVFGLEGEAGYSWAEDEVTVSVTNPLSGLVTDLRGSTEYGFTAAATGRIGFATDRVLFYGKGGLAIADITNVAGDIEAGAYDPSDVTRDSEMRLGYAIGGGVEFAVTNQWSIKGEYMFADFENSESGNIDGDEYLHENQMHSIKIGLNYRF